jgi:hypothetical protein
MAERLVMNLGETWTDLPVAPADQAMGVLANLGILAEDEELVVLMELITLPAEGEEQDRLPAMITVAPSERGPRVSEKATLPHGRTVYRSVGSVASDPQTSGSQALFLCCHAMRLNGVDIVARTWLGPDPRILKPLLEPIEELLDSITVEDGVP